MAFPTDNLAGLTDHRERHEDIHRRLNDVIDIREYASIAEAIAAAGETGLLYFPPGTHNAADTLTINCHVDAHPEAVLVSSAAGVAVQIGDGAQIRYYRQIRLPRITRAARTWKAGALGSTVGVMVNNLHRAIIAIPLIQWFSVGLWLNDTSAIGTCNNTVMLGRLEQNAVNLRIHAEHADGFVNQNLFLGGSMGLYAPAGDPAVVPGTRQIEVLKTTNRAPGENNFYSTNVESEAAEYHLYAESNNTTYDTLRWENAPALGGVHRIRFSGDAWGNEIRGGSYFHPEAVVFDEGTGNNRMTSRDGNCVWLRSPDKTLYKITVANGGTLSVTPA